MIDAPRRRAAALLAGAALLATAAGCGGLPLGLRDAPEPFAFAPADHQIPGALVVSGRALLTGMLNRHGATVHAEGAAEQLVIDGEHVGNRAVVEPPTEIAVAVRAPSGYGETAVGRVRVNGTTADFRVTTLSEPPRDRLALRTARVRPGRTARTPVVAPKGFAPGSKLEVRGLTAVQVETREGRFDLPRRLDPGEPFRLVARVPERQEGPLDVQVRLGTLRTVWRIEPTGQPRKHPQTEPEPAAAG